jgi:hypothetical protein
MKLVTGFSAQPCHLGTTRQAADSYWLTDEHSVVELHEDQCGAI